MFSLTSFNNMKGKKLYLRGMAKSSKVVIDYDINHSDIDKYDEKITMGTAVFGLIHPDDVKLLISSGEIKSIDSILAYAIDGIISLIELAPALLSEEDKWFGVYLIKLLVAINEREL